MLLQQITLPDTKITINHNFIIYYLFNWILAIYTHCKQLLTLIFNAFVNDLIVNSPAHHSAFKTQTEKQTKTVYFILQNTM